MIFKNFFRPKPHAEPGQALVIVGLGNPGDEYALTRHNAGFLAVDWLRERFDFDNWHVEKKFEAEVTTGVVVGKKVFLVKPLVYMNESGRSVRALLDFYRLTPKQLIVIHDDIDIAAGKMKTAVSSSAAGHNGVQSLIDALDTQDFRRLRLGIGRPIEIQGSCIPIHDYVLGRLSAEEQKNLEQLFPEVELSIREILQA